MDKSIKLEEKNSGLTGNTQAIISHQTESDRLMQFFIDHNTIQEILQKLNTKNITTKELRKLIGSIQINEMRNELLHYENLVSNAEKGIIDYLIQEKGLSPLKSTIEIEITADFENLPKSFNKNLDDFLSNKRYLLEKFKILDREPSKKFKLIFKINHSDGEYMIEDILLQEK